MLIADLDRELSAAIAELVWCDALAAVAAGQHPSGRTWRPAPGGDPASYATSLPFELARSAGRAPGHIAAALAEPLRDLSWVAAAEPSGPGYLTITVTAHAQAQSAARMAAAGADCARSTVLSGTAAVALPWPDPAAAPSWRQAWQAHAGAMTSRLAQAAGADTVPARERASFPPVTRPSSPPGVPAAVAWFGADSVRYRLASTGPGQVSSLGRVLRAGTGVPDPLHWLRRAQADAAASRRRAADLHMPVADPGDRAGELLADPAERALLGLLSWLPVRVAAGAGRHRPDELPRYLEEVRAAWQAARQSAPALPYGGQAAPASSGPAGPALAGARLTLADAVATVLAAGLALTGVTAVGSRD